MIFYLLWKPPSTSVKIFLKVLESIFSPHIAALKIRIWCTKDLFPENIRKKSTLADLIALILSCSKLRNKFQLGNTAIISAIELLTSEYPYLGLLKILMFVLCVLSKSIKMQQKEIHRNLSPISMVIYMLRLEKWGIQIWKLFCCPGKSLSQLALCSECPVASQEYPQQIMFSSTTMLGMEWIQGF